jgi:hypothetical protein
MLSDIILVESKSGNEKHHAEQVFEKIWVTKMSGISKYCLWLVCQNTSLTKYKRFEDVLEYINKLQKTSV